MQYLFRYPDYRIGRLKQRRVYLFAGPFLRGAAFGAEATLPLMARG